MSNFSLYILIFNPYNSLLLKDYTVNKSFYKLALCHPGNYRSDFFKLKKLCQD